MHMAGDGEQDDMPDRDAERGALHEIADVNSDAMWGDTDAGRAWVPGVVSGDLGPKGKVAAQLRHTSRSERRTYGEVPYGVAAPGTGRYVLIGIFGVVAVLIGVVALIFWLAQ